MTRLFSVKCRDLHFTQFRVQHNEGAAVTDRRQHGGAGEAKEQSFNCAATHLMRWEYPAGGRRSPVCWEGQLVHSASVDGLHVHRLRFQEVRHSHCAQFITWGRMTAVNQKPAETANAMSVLFNTWMEWLTDDNDAFLVWVPSHSGGGGVWGINAYETSTKTSWNVHDQKIIIIIIKGCFDSIISTNDVKWCIPVRKHLKTLIGAFQVFFVWGCTVRSEKVMIYITIQEECSLIT